MAKLKPAMILVPMVIAALGVTSYAVQKKRDHDRSALSGFFETQPTQVSSRIQGRIKRIAVREGDSVEPDSLLVELEAVSATQSAEASNARAKQAQEQYLETANGSRIEDIQKQEGQVAEAEANLKKLKNGPLPEEIRQARARLMKADAQLAKLVAGPRPQEIAESRAALRNAEAKVAQLRRGLTPQEKQEARARLDTAIAQEAFARRESERYAELFREDAISRQQADSKQSDYETAISKRKELEAAWQLAVDGTPKEEMEQAVQLQAQAQAALDLLLAGSRKEDIQAGKDDVSDARQGLDLLLRGTRKEDIAASEARLATAFAALAELRNGNRKETIKQAAAAADAARLTANSDKTNTAERIVSSPVSGTIDRIPVSVGDLVNAGTPLIRITDTHDIWIRVYVPEANLKSATVGASVKLKVDGIPDQLDAVVDTVSSQGEFTPANLQTPDDRGKQVFGVRIRLVHADNRIKPGIYATVKQIGDWQP